MASQPLAPAQLPPGQFLARRVIDFCLPFEGLLCALKLKAKCPLPSEIKKKLCFWPLREETWGAGDSGGTLAQACLLVTAHPLPCAMLHKAHLWGTNEAANVVHMGSGEPTLHFLACDL